MNKVLSIKIYFMKNENFSQKLISKFDDNYTNKVLFNDILFCGSSNNLLLLFGLINDSFHSFFYFFSKVRNLKFQFIRMFINQRIF